MLNVWMIREGEGGQLISEFKKGYIAIRYLGVGDLTHYSTRESVMDLDLN